MGGVRFALILSLLWFPILIYPPTELLSEVISVKRFTGHKSH